MVVRLWVVLDWTSLSIQGVACGDGKGIVVIKLGSYGYELGCRTAAAAAHLPQLGKKYCQHVMPMSTVSVSFDTFSSSTL